MYYVCVLTFLLIVPIVLCKVQVHVYVCMDPVSVVCMYTVCVGLFPTMVLTQTVSILHFYKSTQNPH